MPLIKWNNARGDLKLDTKVMEAIAAKGSSVVVHHEALESLSGKRRVAAEINRKVLEVNLKGWMENLWDNIRANVQSSGVCFNSVERFVKSSDVAVVVGGGPSLKKQGHLKMLKTYLGRYDIIVCDRAFIPMLKEGYTPLAVVSVDGDREKIWRWYDHDFQLSGYTVFPLIAVTVAPITAMTARNKLARNPRYFVPALDDPTQFGLSRALSHLLNLPVVETGGNVGLTCMNLAAHFGYKSIILVGLDLGYPADLPVEQSAYYPVVKEAKPDLTPEKFKDDFTIPGTHPMWGAFYSDLVYWSHREYAVKRSLELEKMGVTLWNCTEGGSLYGGAVKCRSLKEVLEAL